MEHGTLPNQHVNWEVCVYNMEEPGPSTFMCTLRCLYITKFSVLGGEKGGGEHVNEE